MVTVVKIGGSLFPEHTTRLCEYLSKSEEDIVLVNGGGELANKLREYDKEYNYSDDTMHWNAIKCMDIIGNMIADKCNSIETVNSLEEIYTVLNKGKIPLILTYEILKKEDPLKHSWQLTSDSIACWFAHRLNAKLLILTNVDGIYNGNIFSNDKKLIKSISANELLIFEETSVDKCLPKLLIKYNLDCFVMNGINPEIVLCHLNGNHTINKKYTHIRR